MSSILANWLWPMGPFAGAELTILRKGKVAVTQTFGNSRKIRGFICWIEDVPSVPCTLVSILSECVLFAYVELLSEFGIVHEAWASFFGIGLLAFILIVHVWGRCVSDLFNETHDRMVTDLLSDTIDGETSPLVHNTGWHQKRPPLKGVRFTGLLFHISLACCWLRSFRKCS